MNEIRIGRREALGMTGAVLAGCAVRGEVSTDMEPLPLPGAATAARLDPRTIRWAPANELVNTMEFEEQAQRVLSPELFAEIAGSDREPLDRVTFRPRMNVPTLDMDLGANVFGQTLFTPLVLGPVEDAGRYHEEGEAGLVRGAAEAHTTTIISSRSQVPIAALIEQVEVPVWFGVRADEGDAAEQARRAAEAGADALVITVERQSRTASPNWNRLDGIRRGLDVPAVIRGMTTAAEAAEAVTRGYDAIVVSAPLQAGAGSSIVDSLPVIADVVGGRIALFAEGGFRRGADIMKGLALGADAVLMQRPAAWALAAYGSEGVRSLLQLVHEELARNFGMLGVSKPGDLTPDHIRVHSIATS